MKKTNNSTEKKVNVKTNKKVQASAKKITTMAMKGAPKKQLAKEINKSKKAIDNAKKKPISKAIRTKQVCIRVNEAEYKILKRNAKKEHISTYIRSQLFGSDLK